MARLFTAASSEIAAHTAGALLTAVPLTLVAWVKLTAVGTTSRTIVTLRDKDNADVARHCFNLEMSNLEYITARTGAVSNSSVATHIDAVVPGEWTHAAAVFTSATEYKAFKNGSGTAATVTSRVPAGVDSAQVGGSLISTSSVGNPWDGDIAEAAVYNVALTDAEVAMLAAGYSPLMVRPDALVAYWDIVGNNSPETDGVGRYDLTLTGTAKSEHPRAFRPSAQILRFPSAAGGINSGAGASTGTSTAAAVGAAIKAGAGSSTGAATVTGIGAAIKAGAGSSVGTSTASGVGADGGSTTTDGAGSAVGTSTASGVGAAIKAGAGSAVGTSTATGVGADASAPVTEEGRSSAGGKTRGARPGRVIGYVPPEKKKPKEQPKERQTEQSKPPPKPEEPYAPAGNLGAVIQFPERVEKSEKAENQSTERLPPEYISLLDRVESQAREIDALRDEIKATAELKVLEKLEEEARLLSQSELESLLLLMVVE